MSNHLLLSPFTLGIRSISCPIWISPTLMPAAFWFVPIWTSCSLNTDHLGFSCHHTTRNFCFLFDILYPDSYVVFFHKLNTVTVEHILQQFPEESYEVYKFSEMFMFDNVFIITPFSSGCQCCFEIIDGYRFTVFCIQCL